MIVLQISHVFSEFYVLVLQFSMQFVVVSLESVLLLLLSRVFSRFPELLLKLKNQTARAKIITFTKEHDEGSNIAAIKLRLTRVFVSTEKKMQFIAASILCGIPKLDIMLTNGGRVSAL